MLLTYFCLFLSHKPVHIIFRHCFCWIGKCLLASLIISLFIDHLQIILVTRNGRQLSQSCHVYCCANNVQKSDTTIGFSNPNLMREDISVCGLQRTFWVVSYSVKICCLSIYGLFVQMIFTVCHLLCSTWRYSHQVWRSSTVRYRAVTFAANCNLWQFDVELLSCIVCLVVNISQVLEHPVTVPVMSYNRG